MKKLVIAPYEAHESLYKIYRKDNPFIDVKFYTLDSFLAEANFQSDDSTLIYLIKKYDLDFETASEYLRFIKRIKLSSSKDPKISKLIDIQKDLLDNSLLFKNEYFDYELKNADIDIYFYSEYNQELLNVIKDKKYQFIKFKKKDYPLIHSFNNSEDELSFVFNKICSLIDNGVSPKDIYLYGLAESDELSFIRLKDHYGLYFNNAFKKNFLTKNYINSFINNLISTGNIDIPVVEDNCYEQFASLVNKYRIEGIDKDRQANIYKGVFKKTYIKLDKYVDGINVINRPLVKENGYLFIVNFVQGKYPTIKRDSDYLSNPQKEEIGLNTTEIENRVNLDEFSQYLLQNSNIFVSFSNRNYSEKYYPSPLIKLLKLEVKKDAFITDFYSMDEAKLTYANLKDLRKNYLDKNPLLKSFINSDIPLPYRTYDYRYRLVKHYVQEEVLKLSYSQVKTYCECKFKYYLDRVIKLDESETTFSLNIGTLAHNIFERIDSGLDFESLYQEELSKIDSFGEFDWVYLRRIKQEIKRTFDYIKQFEEQITNPKVYRETFGSFDKYIDLDANTKLTGKIDKLIMFGDNSFAIIDYKSGKEQFSETLVEYGLSLQLPTYALIAKEGDKFKDKQLAGLFIQRFINTTTIASKIDVDNEELPLLRGVFINDIDTMKKLDSSLSNAPSRYISSCKIKGDGSFAQGRNRSEEYFERISNIAREFITKSSHSILDNDFAINPKIIKGKNESCSYCPYRDICYRDERAFEMLSNGLGDEDASN